MQGCPRTPVPQYPHPLDNKPLTIAPICCSYHMLIVQRPPGGTHVPTNRRASACQCGAYRTGCGKFTRPCHVVLIHSHGSLLCRLPEEWADPRHVIPLDPLHVGTCPSNRQTLRSAVLRLR